MKKSILRRVTLYIVILFLLVTSNLTQAQGYSGPLTFQGIDKSTYHSAAARAAGNISSGAGNDIALMFQNPATLESINSLHISLGGLFFSRDLSQEQNYAPVRYYPNLSLLLEDLTDQIPDPPPDTSIFAFGTVMDTVQRPYDDLGPNWSNSKKDNLPVQVMLALPILSSDSYRLVAGIGAVEYANLYHYYQNNNVLSPSILSQRPLPTFRPTDDNPVDVDWSQQIRSRSGSINGYGFAMAGRIEKFNLSVGFSGLLLDGNSDDYEQITGRGKLTFFSNAFRLDSVHHRIIRRGTSDFSGQEFTLSSILTGKYASLGFSVKLPNTIERSYSLEVTADTAAISSVNETKGTEKLKLNWRGIIGLSLTPKENLRFGLEYEFRPYESVKYVDTEGVESTPWLSASLFRVGMEYRLKPWLLMRGGMRGNAEVFNPEGNKIDEDPVISNVYSAGLGIIYSGFQLNIAYENSLMKYQDIWSSAISKNKERNHIVVADISYQIPWIW